MAKSYQQYCPVAHALDLIGERWSLLVVRDLLFIGPRTYNQLLSSDEGIATNVLAGRLSHLEEEGIIQARPDPDDGRRRIYSLTQKGLDLAPVVLELSLWGVKHEGGVGPRAEIRRWKTDRAAFLAEMRERWLAGR